MLATTRRRLRLALSIAPSYTLAILALLLPLAAQGQAGEGVQKPEKRAFEIADFYRSVFIDSQSLSPDGRFSILAVRHYRLEKGESWTELWRVSTENGDAQQMTFGEKNDGSPVVTPDGKNILFVSDRGGESSQLWILPTRGGGARQLTDFSMGVSSPVVSPDGRYVAVTSKVYPECGADSACNAEIRDTWKNGPLNAHVADELLFRHWTSWSDGRFPHILLVELATGKVLRDLTPEPRDSPTFSASGPSGYAFSPDSKELCFVSNPEMGDASATTTNADLWTVSLVDEDAPAKNLTATNRGWDAQPTYSPDGRTIAYLSMKKPGYEADLTRVVLYDRSTGQSRLVTDRESFDNRIHQLGWAKDSKSLFFDADHHGRNPVYRLDLASGAIEEQLRHSTLASWELTSKDDALVYISRAIDSPTELYRAKLGGKPQALTSFNEALRAEVDIRPAEEMWVEGDDGTQLHLFLVKPHDFDPKKKYPLILNVHGGPQGMWADSYRGDWQVYPGKGYVLAFGNPTGSTGYGQDLTDAIACDWGGRVYRDLMKMTDQLEVLPYVDKDRMGAMGWSYGGYMMMWFAGHTERFKTLAAMMGLYDLPSFYGATEELWFPEGDLCGEPWNSEHYEKWSPSESAAKFKTPSLVITGELDYRVPYTQSLQFFTALRRQGVPSRLVVFPEAGHWPSWYEMAFYYLAHLDWFHQYLGGGEPPWAIEDFLRNKVFRKKAFADSEGEAP